MLGGWNGLGDDNVDPGLRRDGWDRGMKGRGGERRLQGSLARRTGGYFRPTTQPHTHTTTSPPKPPGSASHYSVPTRSLVRLAIIFIFARSTYNFQVIGHDHPQKIANNTH